MERKLTTILVVLGMLYVAAASELRGQDEGGAREIQISSLPSHLETSALFEFLKSRGLRAFPNRVETIVQQLTYADAAPLRVFIPRGRSAQFAATDERKPRIVIAPHAANKLSDRAPVGFEDYTPFPGPDLEGRLFFGFAKRTGKGEGISWNRKSGRFDYFVFTGIGGSGPGKIYEVTQRQDCTKCHHNEGPIWVVPPWSEIMNHDPLKFSSQPSLQKFSRDPIVYQKDGVLLSEEQTPIENNGAFSIDTSVSVGNRLVQSTRVIRELCGKDISCRRYILLAALANPNQSNYLRKTVVRTANTGNDLQDLDFIVGPLNPIRALLQPGFNGVPQLPRYLEGLESYVRHNWPRDDFAFQAQILIDPVSVISGQTLVGQTIPVTTSQRNSNPETARFPLGPIPRELGVPYIYDVAFETLGFTFQEALKLQAIPLPERMRRLSPDENYSASYDLQALLSPWPPSPADVMKYFGLKDDEGDDVAHDANPVVANNTGLPPLFQAHCIRCHSTQDGDVPFIPFQDPAALRKYNSDNQKVIEQRLTQRTMPPSRVSNRPTETEYQTMLQFFTPAVAATAGPKLSIQKRGTLLTNYLGIRYQNVSGYRYSYIVPSSVSVVQEGHTDDCGMSLGNDSGSSPGSHLRAGLGSDRKVYLALENFPHFFMGNIVQISASRDSAGECRVLGVSRNGKLLSLGYSYERDTFGTIPFERDSGSPAISLFHVMGDGVTVLAVGKDGNLYQVLMTGPYDRHYALKPVTLDGIGSGKWIKVAPSRGEDGEREYLLESIEGLRIKVKVLLNEGAALVLQRVAEYNVSGSGFSPNLLDKSAVLLIPGGMSQ